MEALASLCGYQVQDKIKIVSTDELFSLHAVRGLVDEFTKVKEDKKNQVAKSTSTQVEHEKS